VVVLQEEGNLFSKDINFSKGICAKYIFLGCDFIFDKDLNVYLLELNVKPICTGLPYPYQQTPDNLALESISIFKSILLNDNRNLSNTNMWNRINVENKLQQK